MQPDVQYAGFDTFVRRVQPIFVEALDGLATVPLPAPRQPTGVEGDDYVDWILDANTVGELLDTGTDLAVMAVDIVVLGDDLPVASAVTASLLVWLVLNDIDTDPPDWFWILNRIQAIVKYCPRIWEPMSPAQRIPAWKAVSICLVKSSDYAVNLTELYKVLESLASFIDQDEADTN